MCGIAAIYGDDDPKKIRLMLDQMSHRGPDASGIYRDPTGRAVLGHQRLSIMDPECGDQPIVALDGDSALVVNGEIYNFRELERDPDLTSLIRTGSDSEVILRMREARGRFDPVELDGMFAFAFSNAGDFVAARDPVGIKPLYVGRAKRGMTGRGKGDGAGDADDSAGGAAGGGVPRADVTYVASEIKALLPVADEVEEVPPGTTFHPERGFERYTELPDREPEQRSVEAWIRALRDVMGRAVEKRLMSDVPLGTFLSGGLDSSIITALARRRIENLHTFAVGVEGSPDLEAARLVADHLGTHHHEHIFTAREVIEDLPRVIYHLESFDQDLVRSAVPCHFTSRMASRHVKAILTGEGADELFAGYRYYREIDDPEALHRELHRSIRSLHNINLQRVDRLTMAHGLEGRVPFLDLEVIDLAQRIPPELKLRCDRWGRPCEKWILRKAFEDLLPTEVVWRDKEQFDEGSGTADILRAELSGLMIEEEAESYASSHADAGLRSNEEAAYHRILRRAFARPGPVLDNVARWASRPGLETAGATSG